MKFVCLANSIKEGGRCMAGIELDHENNPVIVNGRPKWIRPICDTKHGEIPNKIAQPFQLLDIIELHSTGSQAQGYQSENISFNEKSMRILGNFDVRNLAALCDNGSMIFSNKGKAVSKEHIADLDHSLVLVSVTEFEAVKKTFEDRINRAQLRLIFKYNDSEYDFPITDFLFRKRFVENPNLLEGVNQLFLCLSIGIEWESWHYKLAAGIIYTALGRSSSKNEIGNGI